MSIKGIKDNKCLEEFDVEALRTEFNQEISDLKEEINNSLPTKTSELENDSDFITSTAMNNLVVMITTTLSIPVLNAGDEGYFETPMVTIPNGYRTFNVITYTDQIDNTEGLQLTPIYGHHSQQGTVKFRFNYYAPHGTASAMTINVMVQCIKANII